ncbi:MAG TPA: exodeoxyribonuclease VII small subunit [Phycisphaerae bacterium]|nr:exodeoxyribonuclease VII small subunit [Phycisphaerae bacterium]
MAKAETEEKLTFEKAMEKLEAIVSAIEAGEVPLEESIEKYAEGIELVKQCRTILNRAEKKIQLLGKGGEESLTVTGELEEDTDEPPDPDGS